LRQSLFFYRLQYVSENREKYVYGLTWQYGIPITGGGKFLIFRKGNPAKMMPIY
jgi:hypothetical protein